MKLTQTALPEVWLIEPEVYPNNRGYWYYSWDKTAFLEQGLPGEFVQEMQSKSSMRGALSGLHLQNHENPMAKLVRCIEGEVLDVAVDVRRGSPTYLQWVAYRLSAENGLMLYVPASGFAHGYLTLTDNAEILYRLSNFYDGSKQIGIRYDDPEFGIDWPVKAPILTDRDRNAPYFKDVQEVFIYEESL